MALMLRMLGIPARVAAGFTPGSYNRETKEYRVRDLDAHSWVEVWFEGIGWVPFDPTPSDRPGRLAVERRRGVRVRRRGRRPGDAGQRGGAAASAPADGTGDSGESDEAGGAVDPLDGARSRSLLAGAAVARCGARARAPSAVGAQRMTTDIATLRARSARIGGPLPPRLTLRQLEARLERDGGAGGGPLRADAARAAFRAARRTRAGRAPRGATCGARSRRARACARRLARAGGAAAGVV